MQHIVNIFVGEELSSFRDMFASTFRRLHPYINNSIYSAILLTVDKDDRYHFEADSEGDIQDNSVVDEATMPNGLVNYFETLYSRKVTVANPGNQSMVVILWGKLFTDNIFEKIKKLTEKIKKCDSNFQAEVIGFTHQAVTSFIPNPADQLSPEIYKKYFDYNIAKLRTIRESLNAIKLVANRNIDNVALNLNEEGLARICAEYAALMCEHYLHFSTAVLNFREYPFESFGMSSILFDVEYYKKYIRNRILIDKIADQGVEKKVFNLNSLAQKTNPILSEAGKDIKGFYDKEVANVKAQLEMGGSATTSNIVGTVNQEIKSLVENLRKRINDLLTSGKINLNESEALLALILGEDSSMFESSAVGADELILDDLLDESSNFFIDLDNGETRLNNVSQGEIKEVRNKMRNIALANRHREKRLDKLNAHQKEEETLSQHIEGDKYIFRGKGYNLNLEIDTEPLEKTYVPHSVSKGNVDLRQNFSPIRDQGHQGSCASFAVTSVIEALSKGTKRYSPAFLYWVAREAQGNTSVDAGASLYAIIKAATEKGVCLEEYLPYDEDKYMLKPSDTAYEDAGNCKILEAKTLVPRINDIKSALSDGYPVIVAAQIFDSFSDTASGFVSNPTQKELNEGRSDRHGTHALVVCGYSDNEKVFVVRNSWGTGFGENGYCYIPYSYAEKYFLQACIITELSTSFELINSHGVINFNLHDRKLEDAILRNLIAEDNEELCDLAAESERLKSYWTENIAILGNVNNQADIVKKNKANLDIKIKEEQKIINDLQSTMVDKLKVFKRNYIKTMIYLGIGTVMSWIVAYSLREYSGYSWIWGIALLLTLVFAIVYCAYSYKWRRYRQELRDDIQDHAAAISAIKKKQRSLDLRAHIHGSILTQIEEYRSWLLSEYHKLQLFNKKIDKLYEVVKSEQAEMTPTVSYPFLAVLENSLLDKYYNNWRDRMARSLDWHSVYNDFDLESDLAPLLQNNDMLNAAVIRGLKDFSMKEYVSRSNPMRWQFLPDNTRMSEVIPDLDSRAKPFSPYKPNNDDMEEKYIFIKNINHDDMQSVMPYFRKPPMPIRTSDPYSISVLNIVRFDIKEN